MTWYANDRVMGLGGQLNDAVIQSSNTIIVWIEKTVASNDHYHAWTIQLQQARTLRYIESYRFSGSTMYSTVQDTVTNELFLMKFVYANTGTSQADFSLTYSAQKVDSYCGPNGSGTCTIYGSAMTASGAYEGNTN